MRHFNGASSKAGCCLRASGMVLVLGTGSALRRYALIGLTAVAVALGVVAGARSAGTATCPCGLQFASASSQYVRFGTVVPNPGGVTDGLNASTFTLELWFNRTGTGVTTTTSAAGGGGLLSAVPLIAKGRGEGENSNIDMNYFFGIDTATNRLAADFEEGAAPNPAPGQNHSIIGTSPVAVGSGWHHGAVTWDGSTWKLYLDGKLDRAQTIGTFTPRSDSVQRTALGSALTSNGTAGGFFAGQADEVRIWNFARTGAQIRANKNVTISGPQTGLLGRWGLDDTNPTTTAADSSGNGNSGTLVAAPTWITQSLAAQDTTAPAVPQGLQANAGNGRVTIYWTPNSESDVAGYNVFRSESPPPIDTSGTPLHGPDLAPSATFTDTTAVNGTLYYYTVLAVDATNNTSTAATPVSATASASTGSSLSFNVLSPKYVTFGAAPGLNAAQFTLEAWVLRTGPGLGTSTGGGGLPSAVPLITKGRAEVETPANRNMNYFLGIDATSGRLVADFEDNQPGPTPPMGGNHPITGTATVTSGVWHHVAATYGAGEWRLYLDGQLDAQLPVGAFTPEATSIQHAALGTAITSSSASPAAAPDGFFDGILDEVRIWNVVRDQSQIQAAMNTEINAPTANLIGRYGLNEGSGTTVSTSSGSTNGTAVANPSPTWSAGRDFTAVPPSDPVFVGAGDIAGAGWTTDSDTAAVVAGIPGQVFTIGDNVYPDGTTDEFNLYYEPTWGAFKSRTRPAPGNHDYNTPNATGYYGYFGAAAGDPTLGYYSYDVSGNGVTWHIVVVNSECEDPGGLWLEGGCAAGSTQEQWLRNDLETASTNNIIAIWHKPRWSSRGNHQHMQALWQALYDNGVEISLGGHWHHYERLQPMNASGSHDSDYGIRAFTVGTGGVTLGGFTTILPTSEVRNENVHGVIKFTLHASSYDWQFIPIAGQTFAESGTQAVHGLPPPPSSGPALRFNGSNQYVRVGTPVPSPGNTDGLNASTFTLETWFRRTGTGTGTSTGSGGIGSALPLIAKGRAEGGSEGTNRDMNYFLGIDTATNTLAADFEDSATGLNHPVYGETTIDPDGAWHHAAASFDGTDWRLYLDGRLETKLNVGGFSPRSDSIARTAFASALDSTGADAGYFQGDMDEIRIWGVARTGSQIRSAKDDEITGPDTGLLGRWGLAETSGPNANDTSGNNNHGTLENNPTWVAGYGFPQDTTAPDAASALSATPADQSVGLSWTASPSADVAGYNVYRSPSPGVSTTGTPVNDPDLVKGTSYTDTGLTNGTPYYYRVVAVDRANNSSGDSNEATGTPAPSDPVFVGAGDIADCGRTQDSDTAALVEGISGQVFTLGDNVYPNGTATEFANCYGPTWGRPGIKSRTRPTVGNHDFGNGTTPGAAPYFAYFGASAGTAPDGYYSYDLSGNGVTWHIVVLNSECETSGGYWLPGGCGTESAQEDWLRLDLANASTNNIIALMHKPRWSSTANFAHMQAIWQALYDRGVDIALAGHWHNYERFAPMDANGNANAGSGVRAFTVGTGGASLAGFGTDPPEEHSEFRNSSTYGVMKFTLHASNYDWQFISTSGQTIDFGTYAVHPPPTPTAVVIRSFTAAKVARNVVLRWRTASETRLAGFALYRKRGRAYVRLNRAVIPAVGGVRGHTYTWRHRIRPGAATKQYRLRAVKLDGTRIWLGTAVLRR